jgi:hypothetical protein
VAEGNVRDVEETIFILVLFIDAAHEGSGRREDLIDEDEDCFLGAELDTLANNIDELAKGEICRDEVLLLIDGSDIGLLYLLADDLLKALVIVKILGENGVGRKSYRNAVGVLLANAFGFCLALLEGVFVLEFGTHDDYV